MATPATTRPDVPRPAGPQPTAGRTGGLAAALTGTPPRRLQTRAALLALLALLFGVLTLWQVDSRSSAADNVVNHSQPLSDDAAQIFRSLADADTTAATAFLQAGSETAAVRTQYTNDIATASQLLTKAAAQSGAGDPGQQWIRQLNAQLPVYAGLVETAKADDRQGFPLGGAYLRYASGQMQTQMLDEAKNLHDAENRRLASDYADARSLPWAALGLGVVLIAALVRAQVLLFRRTNRVLNPGLVLATACATLALLWLGVGQSVAASYLADSDNKGAAPLQVIDQAEIETLKCRGAENLNLVARGSTTTYETDWETDSGTLNGPKGYFAQAQSMTAGDAAAQQMLTAALTSWHAWNSRHDTAHDANQNGNYDVALGDTIGSGSDTIDAAFTSLRSSLDQAAAHEQEQFRSLADDGRNATSLLAPGAAVLAVLAAAGVGVGVNRRVAEYR
ncbi:hypothetical protein [Streptacidiphilus jiangxiensis]|uniref:Secreted protein n=1 Tax=Streptacidiphilus jiangxiensis TaxID=235985 RepID=A0A1H7S1Y0_STRJI|nr:hypothetical protein [Streptacidiphilus jiangxiensis]SEL66611.1 hypothetical protein SAMN05414137_111110 [Streptacidiphilus jiangxiensis]